MASAFTPPIKVTSERFGKDEFLTLLNYIEEQVKNLKAKTRGIREELMPKWVRTYRGVPTEEQKSWPWPGASNLVIQVAATHSDELLSRVMAMYANDPLYVAKMLGNFDADADDSGEAQRQMLEEFLQDCAYEPEELDMYRVEETGFSSAIRFGTGVFKFPWEYVTEQQIVYIGGGTEEGEKVQFTDDGVLVKRDGPHPEVVPLADWGIDPVWANLNQADFKFHTLHLQRYQVENKFLKHPDIFDKESVEKMLLTPDRQGEYRRQLEEQKRSDTRPSTIGDLFDIEECWLTYIKDGQRIKMISYYHLGTETNLGIIYNTYPENIEPFEDAKLAYDDDTYFGYGFCEMLEAYQREITSMHNWRMDNRQFATTGVGRVNKNSKLASIIQLYPGAMIPADEGEIEPLQFGAGAVQYGTEDEQLTMSYTSARAGVDPASGGSGGGTVNKKGQFSAQGTAVTMQSQNNRNNLRMSDMRSCHVRIGRKLLMMYAYFGFSTKIRKYGDRSALLVKALKSYKDKQLGLIIKPATASVNRELEKQNDILLSATMERLYASDAQMLMAMLNPGTPPELKQLYMAQFRAKNALMQSLLRNFGREDANRLIAVPDFLKQERKNATGQQQQNSTATGQAVQQSSQAQGAIPVGGGAVTGGVPTGAGGDQQV